MSPWEKLRRQLEIVNHHAMLWEAEVTVEWTTKALEEALATRREIKKALELLDSLDKKSR